MNDKCPQCDGTGKTENQYCPSCGGRGHFGPISEEDRMQIEALEDKLYELRESMCISRKDEILAQYIMPGDENLMLVCADGFGGASLEIVEGNYPVDYYTHHYHNFPNEADACSALDWLDEHMDEVDLKLFFEALAKGERPHDSDEVPESIAG